MIDKAVCQVYALGFLDGYNKGSENNIYDPEENIKLHFAYQAGYEAGVALYCEETEPQGDAE